jgi:hypothetical protein
MSNSIESNERNQKIIKQFYLDLPRLNLILDNYNHYNNPDLVKNYLYDKLNKDEALAAIYTMTQTFLADFYIDEFKKIILRNEELLDNKNYDVNINTNKKLVNISKKFKIVHFSYTTSSTTSYIVDYCTLTINLYLENFDIFYSWNSEFESSQKLNIVEQIKLII